MAQYRVWTKLPDGTTRTESYVLSEPTARELCEAWRRQNTDRLFAVAPVGEVPEDSDYNPIPSEAPTSPDLAIPVDVDEPDS
jgi:hypothetical protein